MPTSPPSSCKPCIHSGQCTGYGTQKTCPPLIVIAVLAACQAALPPGGVR